jgi:amino acid adenylation domain-containing protein
MSDPVSKTRDLSPEKLALLVMRMKKRQAAEPVEARRIPRRPAAEPPRLSFAQERLWLLDRIEPGNSAFNIAAPHRLRGPLEVAALRRALDEIVRRHESLRTTFATGDAEPVQVIAPLASFPLPLVDLTALPEAARREEADRLAALEAHQPFDLARGPLFRALLIRCSPEEHLFVPNVHHSVADGWSFSVLFRELSELYAGFLEGRPVSLPELPIQAADFAVWQRGWLQGKVLDEQLAYWRQRLAGSPLVLELPTDRPRPPVQSHRGAFVSHQVPRDLSDRLRELARAAGTSLFMLLLAGFQLVLSRLAGEDDVIVGSPSAGRQRLETEGLIGMFLNTLVLRTVLSGDLSFRGLLARVSESVTGAYQHQELPFEKLLEELQPERQLNRSPIFQVLFNMLTVPDTMLRLAGIVAESLPLSRPEPKFDLTIYVSDSPALRFELLYSADLFDAPRMAEMLRQLDHVLRQAAADPGIPISEISLITPQAATFLPDPRAPLSRDWRGAAHQALSRVAARAPERITLADADGEVWTCGELEARSNQVARHLRAHGVETGDAVVVWAQRNASLVWALLGTLKAGAAFVILDPTYPASRLADLARIARPTGWLATHGAPPPPPELEEVVAGLLRCRLELPARSAAAAAGFLEDLPATDPEVPITPDDAACITFTSGSTGMPKGVIGRHGPLTHYYPWMGERFGLGAEDRFGMLSALSHDPLQRDVFTPLWFGARLTVPDPDLIGAPGYLAEWLRREEVTVLHLTPAMMELILDSAENGSAKARELPALRRVFVVGDLLKKSDVWRLQRLAPALTAINLYGSTETQRSVSFFVVPRPEEPESARLGREVLPLGRGMDGAQVLVLGPEGHPAGIGELGEIYVRSHHLALGYLGDEALTAERFLPNRFAPEAGDRLYRTGDLGRHLPDGVVELTGRADFQVKIRGFRIELGEIESRLTSFPGVRECVVVAREDQPGDRRLVAYLAVTGEPPVARELRAFLAGRLPDYMVPSAFVPLAAFPLTRTGKVDRRALPPPAEESHGAERQVERGPVEQLLSGIWSALLGVADLSSDAHFFELGGHSLLATRLASRVHAVLGVELPARAVFEEPTLGGLAELVERLLRGQAGIAVPPLVPAPRDRPLPLSFSQQRLWFFDQIEPESFAYNLSGGLRLSGPLEVAAFAQALGEIVRRHESLRTTFADREGEPVQVIAPPAPFLVPLLDLASLPASRREETVRELAWAEARRPFDLGRGPLLRAVLLRLDGSGSEHALLVTMHHIVSDGWSLGVFVRELGDLYAAFAEDRPSPLPALAVQYADFAVWQRQWLSGAILEEQLAFWTGQLADAPPLLELPLDRTRPAVQSYRGSQVFLPVGRDLEARLDGVARRLGVTPFMLLAAGFAVLLARSGRQTDVVLGSPIANRGRAELEGLIGFFANTLALRVGLDGNPGFPELARRVREVALGAYAHQELPFERLVDALQPERNLGHAPVFQVMLALQNLPASALELQGITLESLVLDSGRAQFDLSLFFYPGLAEDGGLLARLEYARDLFDPATAERLLGHVRNLLEGIAEDPERRLSELPLLAGAERRELLERGQGPAPAIPPRLLQQLCEASAAERPDATAVSCDGGELSYRELNSRANRLAHHLRRLGVAPESLVAVCLERTPTLPVALLGVLKAGGAYVPLDPGYPADRLAWVLEDSRAALLLTESGLAPQLPPHAGRTLALDALDLMDERAENPEPLAGPENLAYVIYTSGSTGRPKGVAVRQRGAVNFLASMADRPGLRADDVLLAVTTVAFDISVLELFLPLSVGARVELVGRETVVDGLRLAARIASSGATVMQATPATWRLLLETGWKGNPGLKVLCGGEALPPGLARELLERTGELWNVYGPTETTVWSAVHPLAAADAAGEHPIPLGTPVANTSIHLLDRFEHGLDLVPPGAPGELYIGGEGLARGYLGRPDLSAERFVPDPFSGRPGTRLYRTGDLVRRRSKDGLLEFLGRADHQVKIRGFRIELGEIETVLCAAPAVRESVVVVREDVPGSQRLAAYLSLHEGSATDPETLRAVLREKLPDYMVPQLFEILPALPLTPNGKVDRRALQARPAPEGRSGRGEPVAARNPVEQVLSEVWAEVLHLDQVGIHDNFFALGGDSILIIQVVTRCRKRGVRFAPRQLFQNQTIAELATVVDVVEQEAGTPHEQPAVAPSASAGSLTPTDFPEAGLSQDDLDDLLAELSD